ncbi:hypothetical protein RMHFA_03973 [Roseomonas mucosa]|nr:hypothetical protein HVIM_03973 [Roseomonas mucosa]QDD98114.1 hypothetical protein ADP8_03973 [Roseomonas mucosa]UZO90306.1 hypothetical protein RMP42_03973 [Roseomonas mucosa]UZO95148.1 hypothetical protein RMHFA_03973 [Roseomonas mucosa]
MGGAAFRPVVSPGPVHGSGLARIVLRWVPRRQPPCPGRCFREFHRLSPSERFR